MQKDIRNFAIISHVDHGKSTLADRFLELTGTIESKKMRPQFLDMMDLEREKGITIKLQPVRMEYYRDSPHSGTVPYILNMIDTPGHVDFSYEVSRSLAAIEGVVLLVDVLKGIQAQTLMNLELARKKNLTIIPVINKIDLIKDNNERLEQVAEEISNLLKIDKKEIINISAKQGTNVEKVLEAIIEKVPAPKTDLSSPLRALIFDFQYDPFQGVIACIRIMQGSLAKGDDIFLVNSKAKGKAKEVGCFKPERFAQEELKSGEIGYVILGIKGSEEAKIGDTIIKLDEQGKTKPLAGYKEPKPVVFVGLFPENSRDFVADF
jgi:GTP-binding protein LepA